MPLVAASLKGDLEDIYSNADGQAATAANKYATAIVSLWESAIAPGGGSIVATQVQPLIIQGVLDAWGQPNQLPIVPAQKLAVALNNALSGIIITGGTDGVGTCTPLGLSLLLVDLLDIYSNTTDNPAETAQKEAQAIVNFSKATLCVSTGVEAPVPIPKIGPLA